MSGSVSSAPAGGSPGGAGDAARDAGGLLDARAVYGEQVALAAAAMGDAVRAGADYGITESVLLGAAVTGQHTP